MKLEEVKGLFALAGIEVLNQWELTNQYWPEAYKDLRADNPWWLVKTKFGLVKAGMRKRVLVIDWKDTKIRRIVTEDEVTKDQTMVHAYNKPDAVRYLQGLKEGMDNEIPERLSKLTEKDENIIKDILKCMVRCPEVMSAVAVGNSMTVRDLDTFLDALFIKLGNGRVTFEEHAG